MDRLFELFPDKYPELVGDSGNEWTFELGWPRHILEPVDPMLGERAQSCFGLDLSELDKYVEIRSHHGIPLVFSMFHSWAILAPVFAMESNLRLPQVVVHVDAHHDLSASLLSTNASGSLISGVFGIECRLDDAATIEKSIHAGFINKGNFLTAYVLASTGRRIIHVERDRLPSQFFLKPTSEPVEIGNVGTSQHALVFERVANENAWQLLELPELPTSLGLTPGEKVWLDVDLDAFCNRFDGDSDNRGNVGSRAEMDAMSERMGRFWQDLSGVEWLGDIAAVSIAASPGFFPSEYWEAAIPIARDEIVRLL
jgi:hypothetical protein